MFVAAQSTEGFRRWPVGHRHRLRSERCTQCMPLSAPFNPEPVSLTPRLMAEA